MNTPRPRLLIFVSTDSFFTSHYAHVALAAQHAGYEVGVLTRVTGIADVFTAQGLQVFNMAVSRRSLAPWHLVHNGLALYRALRHWQPHLLHIISLRLILLAMLPCWFAPRVKIIAAVTGLGHFWTTPSCLASPMRALIRIALRCRPRRMFFLFQNKDDAQNLGLHAAQRAFIPGAGIDPDFYAPLAEPPPPLRIAVVSRLLHSKGILEAVEAFKMAQRGGPDILLDLWGLPDAENPRSLTVSELQALTRDGVAWRGHAADVREVWRCSSIAVLLSVGEGVPRCLLEAAACGRPIVTTDVPGCREVVRDGVDGFLVPLGDTAAAAKALLTLANDETLRQRMGRSARARAAQDFTQERVSKIILDAYAQLLNLKTQIQTVHPAARKNR